MKINIDSVFDSDSEKFSAAVIAPEGSSIKSFCSAQMFESHLSALEGGVRHLEVTYGKVIDWSQVHRITRF